MSKLFGRNPHLKVIAFTLSVVLYFFVVAEKETTRDFTIELAVGHVPPEHVVLNDLPDITVSLRGSARAFARLDTEALRSLTIDVADPEITRREIREADLRLASHFTVESIAPRWIGLDLDRIVSRELPVRPIVRGTPARGFEANDPVAVPDTIMLSAPSSYFPEFEAVFTEGIDITGADAPVTRRVGLSIQRPYVTYPPDTAISVTIEVATVVETRTLEGVPMVITGPDASRCSVDVGSIAVTVTGPKTLVDALNPYDIFAGVDCTEFELLGPGIYTPEPAVKNLARGITVVETVPEVLQLTVAPEPEPPPEPQPLDGSGDALPTTPGDDI